MSRPRPFRPAKLVVAGLALTILAGLAMPAEARRSDEAQARVAAVIDELGIQARVKSINVTASGGGGEAPSSSYTGWVSLNDCKGNLVIVLSPTSSVRSLYTTGDCSVPGVD